LPAQQPSSTTEPVAPELILQTGQSAPVRSMAFSPDGKLLASGGFGELAIHLWELSTGRQLEHWHTGAMTRRAATLDALEPGPVASVSRGTIARLGIAAGDMVRVSTRRGTIELAVRQDDGVPDGVVYIPFAFVEAAANLLTNPALDPFGKIPEFKYCAAKLEALEPARVAAE